MIVVGLFQINSQLCQWMRATEKINAVQEAVLKTYAFAEERVPDMTKGLRAIFLAPEYCFAKPLDVSMNDHSFGTQRQMDEDYVKTHLRPTFGQLSMLFSNALIVPGTVAWRKSILPAQGRGNKTPQQIEQHRRQKYAQRIGAAANINVDEGALFTEDTPAFPAAYKRPDDLRPSLDTAKSKKDLMQTARYIAKNTAYCYYNSKEPHYKYDKIGDFYEVFMPVNNPDTVIVPNRESKVSGTTVAAGRFSIGQLDFGIAICYDQSLSVQTVANGIRSIEPLQRTANAVDFHLLLSAHIPPSLTHANLKDGGYLLSCSSSTLCSSVTKKDGTKMNPVKNEPVSMPFGLAAFSASVDLYLIP